uniref:Uncharacterized protein n=1 Tax=Oryza meridionalis TaxID=40149 RepID=A0A0E0BXI2_9ORYZ
MGMSQGRRCAPAGLLPSLSPPCPPGPRRIIPPMFPMPIEDTRLNASNLGEDTTESLTKPSTTDNLLFERSRFDKYGSLQNEKRVDKSRDSRLVRCPIPGGIWPAKLGVEISVSRSNPVAGSCDALKSLPPRLRYLSDVRLKTAVSRPPLCRRRPPRSREVTRPPPLPFFVASFSQRTPAQRQQSVPARHDRNAVADAVVAENDRFSWSSAAAWSGKQGSERASKLCNRRTSTSNIGSYSREDMREIILAAG